MEVATGGTVDPPDTLGTVWDRGSPCDGPCVGRAAMEISAMVAAVGWERQVGVGTAGSYVCVTSRRAGAGEARDAARVCLPAIGGGLRL